MKFYLLLAGLVGLGVFGLIFWRIRVYVIAKLREDVYIENAQGQVSLIAPPLKGFYKLILGPTEFEKVKRRQESKVLYLEPIIEDAKAILASGKGSSPSEKPVFFTAFYPKQAALGSWHNIVVYMHIESAVKDILKDVQRHSNELQEFEESGEIPEIRMKDRRSSWLTQGSRITLLPRIPGVKFNPVHQNIWWVEDFNRAVLYFTAGGSLAGKTIEGEIAAHVGLIQIASIPVSIRFEEPTPLTDENVQVGLLSSSTQMYRNIFASYDMQDREITETLLKALVATGDDVLLQCITKKGIPEWNELQHFALQKAKNFQLFWSANAAKSSEVKKELQALLQSNGDAAEKRIHPVYWTEPMPSPPKEMSGYKFKYIPEKLNK